MPLGLRGFGLAGPPHACGLPAPATIASYFFLPTPEPADGLTYVAVDLSFSALGGPDAFAKVPRSGGEGRAAAAARSTVACGEGSREAPLELLPETSFEGGSWSRPDFVISAAANAPALRVCAGVVAERLHLGPLEAIFTAPKAPGRARGSGACTSGFF